MKYKIILILILSIMPVFSYASSEHGLPPIKQKWSFDGAFGKIDKESAQRGFQVYKEVCAACHSLKLLSYRQLMDLGFSAEEVKAIAAEQNIADTDDNGQAIERPAIPADKFVLPYPNEKAARAANNNALPPDLSLMVKAREEGPDYIYSLLTGFNEKKPENFVLEEGMHYNPYFPGHKIAMSPPLSDGQVTYQDGTKDDVAQMAKDVVNFLQWTAEPEMEQRKLLGLRVLAYLFIMTIVVYLVKKTIWSRLK